MANKITLTDLGIPASEREVSLCQGRVDPLTRQGAFIVKSDVQADEKGQISSVDISYWYRLPSNDAPHSPLSLFKIDTDEDGNVSNISVAGRRVKLSNVDAVNAVKQAIRYVHDALKENDLPELAKIVNDTDLHRTVGDNIKINGQKKEGGFDFKFLNYFNRKSAASDEELVLPSDPVMLRALFGISANSLTPKLTLNEPVRQIETAHVATNNNYVNTFKYEDNDTDGFNLHASVTPEGQDDEPVYYPDLIEVFTSASKGQFGTEHKLDKIQLANVDLTGSSNNEKMEAIGAINGMMRAASTYSAPVPIKHLAEFNLLKLATSERYLKNSEVNDGFKFQMVSEFGNSLTNVHAGFGNGLGACKRISAGGVVGMHDFAFEPSRDGSEFSGAIPNVTDWIDDMDFITLTHRHIDHAGGLPYEDFSGKTIICTPQVFEHAKRQLRTAHGAKAKHMIDAINWQVIDKPGAITFSKDDGQTGITIVYSPNATSHSTYTTPFYYAAFYTDDDGKKQIKGIYANMGDLRDERSEEVDDMDDRFKKKKRIHEEFFTHEWREHLFNAHDDLAWEDIPESPTYCDWDSTSVRSEGETPKVDEVLDNMLDAVGWCEGRTILNVHLASSDNMFEIMLHTAAHHRRDFTVFGKNMEDTQSVQNIFGYDELDRPWPKGHQNQILMDTVHRRNLDRELLGLKGFEISKDEMVDIMHEYIDQYRPYMNARSESAKISVQEKFGDVGTQPRRELEYVERWERLYDSIDKLDGEIYDLENKAKKLQKKSKSGNSPKADSLLVKAADLKSKRDEKIAEATRTECYFARKYFTDGLDEGRADYANALLKKALHDHLSEYSNNYWRFERREAWATEFDIDYRDMGGIVITRNTNTSASMFEKHPENLYVVLTGSQGNEVEVEAQLNKILENRALLHGIDPEYRHTARPIDKQNTVLFNTQSVIPTNEKARNMLINRAVKEHGFVTFNATHTGFELYNYHHMKPERVEWIEQTLQAKDPLYEKKDLRHMIIAPTMAIGYKGHGRGGDLEPWMNRVKAEINASQHVNNTEAARIIETVAKSLKQGTIELVQDGEIVEIDRFSDEKATVKGKVPRGIVLLRNDHPYQKPFKQIMHRESVKVIEAEGSATYLDPLLAGAPSEMTISTIFGLNADAEMERDREPEKGKMQPSFKPAPVDVKDEQEDEWGKRTPAAGVAVPGTDKWSRAKDMTLKLK